MLPEITWRAGASHRDAKFGTLGIAEIHILPPHVIQVIKLACVQRARDGPDQGPRRQPFDQRRRTDEVGFDLHCCSMSKTRLLALLLSLFVLAGIDSTCGQSQVNSAQNLTTPPPV